MEKSKIICPHCKADCDINELQQLAQHLLVNESTFSFMAECTECGEYFSLVGELTDMDVVKF